MTGSLNRRLRVAGVGVLALMTGFGGLAALAAPASAAPTTRYVAPTGNDSENDCTDSANPCQHVQYAVDQAVAGDTVVIAAGEYQESVHIRKSLTLQGAGSTGSGKTVIDGNHDGGVSVTVDGLDVNETTEVTIKDVAVDGNPDRDGIDIEGDATLDLVDSSSSSNGADGISSNLLRGDRAVAGAPPTPVITISGSNVSDNAHEGINAAGTPVHIDHSTVNRNAVGGLVYTSSTADVSTSTFDANTGAGIVVNSNDATLTLATSTVSNTASFAQGEGFGAGVILFGGTADITNSTLAGNNSAGVLNLRGQATVTTSTVSGTHAGDGTLPHGGLVTASIEAARAQVKAGGKFGAQTRTVKKAPAAAPAITVVGSIVAMQDSKVPDCVGTIIDNGYNLSSDAANSCKFSAAKHDQVTTDPLLGPLADNGGPTMTEILKKLSPAIDAIPAGSANCSTSATDQRGVARPQPTGGKCDVGAVELAAKELAIHPNSLPKGKVGKAYHATITATGGQYPIYTFAFVSGSLPDGLTLNAHGKISGKPTKAGTFHFTVSVNDPVYKDYTIVITDDGSASEPVSNTGVHTGSMLAVGGGAVLAGLLLLLWVGVLDRRARGPRIVYGRHHKK